MADVTDEQKNDGTEEETGSKPEELGDAGKRALEAERKARRAAEKRAQEAEARVKERDDADKTEVERLQGQVADLTKRAESAELKAARFEVAADKGLTPAQARRLVGSTKEELETDAEEMRSELGLDKKEETKSEETDTSTDEGGAFSRKPEEKLRAGASNETDEEANPAKLADSILSNRF